MEGRGRFRGKWVTGGTELLEALKRRKVTNAGMKGIWRKVRSEEVKGAECAGGRCGKGFLGFVLRVVLAVEVLVFGTMRGRDGGWWGGEGGSGGEGRCGEEGGEEGWDGGWEKKKDGMGWDRGGGGWEEACVGKEGRKGV